MFALKRASIFLSSIFVTLFLITSPIYGQEDEQVFTVVEDMPQLHGNMDSLKNEIEYPPTAYEEGVEGRVILRFVVNKKGNAQDIQTIRGLGSGLDEEAKRLIKEANFTPGKQRGKRVNVQMNLPIDFKVSEHEAPEKPQPPAEEEEEDFFVSVETMPKPKVGLAQLQKHINYPETARKEGIEGRVIVQFIVNEEGSPEDLRVIRGIGGGCDKEAMRVIREEAKFEPGRQRGEPVRVQYSLPLTFKLQ